MYSIYDNEEFEGQDTTIPPNKDTLIYREVKWILHMERFCTSVPKMRKCFSDVC